VSRLKCIVDIIQIFYSVLLKLENVRGWKCVALITILKECCKEVLCNDVMCVKTEVMSKQGG